MANNKVDTAWYSEILGSWQAKLYGPKVTADQLHTAHMLGNRPGSEALHIAMCLRVDGCTVRQFCMAGSCGPANNKRGLMIKRGLVSSTVQGKPYAFILKLTPKGAALVKANEAKAIAAVDKASAPKAPAKGKTKVATKAASKPKGTPKAKVAPKAPTTPANAPAASPEAVAPQTPVSNDQQPQ